MDVIVDTGAMKRADARRLRVALRQAVQGWPKLPDPVLTERLRLATFKAMVDPQGAVVRRDPAQATTAVARDGESLIQAIWKDMHEPEEQAGKGDAEPREAGFPRIFPATHLLTSRAPGTCMDDYALKDSRHGSTRKTCCQVRTGTRRFALPSAAHTSSWFAYQPPRRRGLDTSTRRSSRHSMSPTSSPTEPSSSFRCGSRSAQYQGGSRTFTGWTCLGRTAISDFKACSRATGAAGLHEGDGERRACGATVQPCLDVRSAVEAADSLGVR